MATSHDIEQVDDLPWLATFYVTDLRHFEGVELDPTAPAEAVRLARYLGRIVRAGTAVPAPVVLSTALACRRRPGRKPCLGRLRVERTDASSRIGWQCPVCGEGGTIEGWQGSIYDLSGLEWPDESPRASVVLEEADYRLLLDELADPDCERVLYAARPHPHGIELSATEDGLEHLQGFVAALANHAPSGARQRRWDAIAARLRPGPSGPRGWLEAAAEVVSEELASFGLAATPPQVAVLVHQRVSAVAEGLGITEASARRYLTDETLRDLARQTAFTIAEERPGADPIDQPREVPMTLNALGRTVAALAEAAQVRILNSDTLGADGAMQVVSLLGQLLHDEATPSGRSCCLMRGWRAPPDCLKPLRS
jgi:hypothetical protein